MRKFAEKQLQSMNVFPSPFVPAGADSMDVREARFLTRILSASGASSVHRACRAYRTAGSIVFSPTALPLTKQTWLGLQFFNELRAPSMGSRTRANFISSGCGSANIVQSTLQSSSSRREWGFQGRCRYVRRYPIAVGAPLGQVLLGAPKEERRLFVFEVIRFERCVC